MRVSSFYGLDGAPVNYSGVRVMPPLATNMYGQEAIGAHVENFFGDPRDGILFTLMDVWVLNAQAFRQWNTICWCPVDHEPVPPKVRAFFAESQAIPLAMSEFGREELAEFDPLYCPHAIETSVLRPLGRAVAREKLGIDQDCFLIGMVAANKGGAPSRKSFVAVLEAFAEFRRRHDNAVLYLHTDLTGKMGAGINLPSIMDALRLPEDSVRFADQYRLVHNPISTPYMALLYSAMDVLANPSMGEGFGIPILEALSCGVPVITSDFTAMRELTGAGWKVSGARQWTLQESWQLLPRVKDIIRAFEQAYRMGPEKRARLSEQARTFALGYDVDTVMDQFMLPALEEAQERWGLRRTVRSGPRKWSVTVVTPWQDHPEFAEEYWRAIEAAKPDQVLVIDDGSAKPVPDAAYRFTKPVGFVRACNKGLEHATGDVVIFLNNDVRLLAPAWLDRIVEACEPGVLVGEIRNDPHCWVDGIPVPYVDGWCLAGMRADLERLGGFDEAFAEPAYYGDNDLSLRATASGMTLRPVRVGLEHLVNGTTDDDPDARVRASLVNRALYEQRVRDNAALMAGVAT